MNIHVLQVAWYRFRATLRHRWRGYLAVVLLIGLAGGLALGAIGGARRTESSFPVFLASTNPSDLTVALLDPRGYDADIVDAISHVAHVKRVERFTFMTFSPLGPDGGPVLSGQVSPLGSIDGLGFDVDRPAVVQGRMADPTRANEFVMSANAARLLGKRLGDVVPFGAYTTDQTSLPGFGTAAVVPYLRLDMTLVGIVVGDDQVVYDDVDRHPLLLFTPALTHRLAQCPSSCLAGYSAAGLQLDHGATDVAAVEADIQRVLPSDFRANFANPPIAAQAARAIKPEVIALEVFGAIAALAALLIAGQMIARQLRSEGDDLHTLRALGAGRAMTTCDGLVGAIGAIVLGSLVAVGVAVALSPLAPIGPVRPVYPSSGIAFDAAVLGLGSVSLIAVLTVITLVIASHRVPDRTAAPGRLFRPRRSSAVRAAVAFGAPTPAVEGTRFALETGPGRDAVPARSALIGATLAIVVVVATLTFGASLHTLVSRPALYGWNWDNIIMAGDGLADIDPAQTTLLDRDPDVAAWAGYYFASLHLDGRTVPVLGGTPKAAVAPPMLSGHGLAARDQVVLGAATLAQLHKHLGDSVELNNGSGPPTHLRIVGTATMPAIAPPAPSTCQWEAAHCCPSTSSLPVSATPRPTRTPDRTPSSPACETASTALRPFAV